MRRRRGAAVVLTHGRVFGADHEADLGHARVRQPAEDVVEEGPPDGNHRLDARGCDRLLRFGEFGAVVCFAHPRAKPTCQYHRFRQFAHIIHLIKT